MLINFLNQITVIYLIKQIKTNKMTQINYYQVLYSDGITQLDLIVASNLTEAKKIAAENAKTKNYPTAYYKVARCYNGGVRGSNPQTNWH